MKNLKIEYIGGTYTVIEHVKGYQLVRIIWEYEDEEAAEKDLIDILLKIKKEYEVEDLYKAKKMGGING
ncbi:hypothetical protein M9R32_12015 [Paenisporosarcina quisquiliarum]|uniref:Uncharacterized protein n=1 Tax=Paenisporosarcina quisquiliarum TaxID=365346 RepID=A0A9X3LHA5_9BACL|nr:hypothetical protein [Paenisporosarcina quisquiliarum]MCZ8537911.1 hypothetical protein [Paenisporosarcina quisquiliarum]